jgi:hypothetical protein
MKIKKLKKLNLKKKTPLFTTFLQRKDLAMGHDL